MLLKNDTTIIRVLRTQDNKSLIIDCIKRTMPKWVATTSLSDFVECTEADLYIETNVPFDRQLTPEERRFAQERYTMISAVLPFIDNAQKRSQMIDLLSEHQSKQTIRKYLCLYLAYQTITVLVSLRKSTDKELSSQEKNYRWALNKFYYTQQKHTLTYAYIMMLKSKYTNSHGELLPEHPSFAQFRYFFRKTRDTRKEQISRNGLKNYQRNSRPLLGDGVREYAPAVGVGMIDSTIADVYLVDDGGKLIGRPIITACVDAFSGLCMGYSLGWEGGVYSLKGLMLNIISDKKSWCQERGVFIEDNAWPCHQLPGVFCCDRGSEYISENFSNICELGPQLTALPSFRPELKSMVERWFGSLQDLYKPYLKGRGYVEKDANERGVSDYRMDACLTLGDFEKIMLHCIIYLNSKRVIDFPFTDKMVADDVKPYANEIFIWGCQQLGANMIDIDAKRLIQTLLPRTTGRFKRNGLNVNGMRYKNDNPIYTESYLSGGEVTVAYNPDDVSECWLIENAMYVPFTLIERRFAHKTLDAAKALQQAQRQTVNAASAGNLQAQLDLAEHIQVITAQSKHSDVDLKNIRSTRKKERARTHIDYTKEII